MENKTIAQQLAENLNRNVVIEYLLERPDADLETYLRMLPFDALSKLYIDVETLDRKEPNTKPA